MAPGAVILVRHGEPALSRKVLLNAAQYRDWWARYEQGSVKTPQAAPPGLVELAASAGRLVSSTRRRAVESAAMAAAGRSVGAEVVFIEAPLPPPPLPAWIRLPPRAWGVLTRFTWWFFDLHADQESRVAAQARAVAAATRLTELAREGGDVLLLAHGFFNTMIARELKARGWRYTLNQGWSYWSIKRFDPPREAEAPVGVQAGEAML